VVTLGEDRSRCQSCYYESVDEEGDSLRVSNFQPEATAMLKSGVRSAPLRLAKPDLKTIDYIFDFFGPTPRFCFDKFRKPVCR